MCVLLVCLSASFGAPLPPLSGGVRHWYSFRFLLAVLRSPLRRLRLSTFFPFNFVRLRVCVPLRHSRPFFSTAFAFRFHRFMHCRRSCWSCRSVSFLICCQPTSSFTTAAVMDPRARRSGGKRFALASCCASRALVLFFHLCCGIMKRVTGGWGARHRELSCRAEGRNTSG